MLIVLGTSILYRVGFNYLVAIHHWDDESSTMKYVLWRFEMESQTLMNTVYYIILAKFVSGLFAFSRRRLSKSLELLRITNELIFYVGITFYVLLEISSIITLSLFCNAVR